MALPDAGTKLRLVLDYLPCEACLAQPVADQDLLCTICARVDREVAVKVGTRTTVLLERPTSPEAPIVIPPAPPMPEAPPAPREVIVRWADEPSPERPGSIEIVVEPLFAAPVLAAEPAAAPVVIPVVAEPEEPDFSVDDIAEYIPPSSDYFDFQRGPPGAYARLRAEPEPVREPEPAPAPVALPPPPPAEPPQDDYVFRPPTETEPAAAPPPVEEEILPVEEVAVESTESDERWAPPADLLPDEPVQGEAEPEPQPEPERWAPPAEPEEEIFEAELVEDEEEVFEMEVVEDEPEPAPAAPAPAPATSKPTGDTDLFRLRGFDGAAETGLAAVGVTQIAHLSGHDAGELSQRSGVPFDRLAGWIQVADLVQEVGVPIDAAVALVAAGVAGPRGLRDSDPEEVADRVAAFGGYTVNSRDVARWKRRA